MQSCRQTTIGQVVSMVLLAGLVIGCRGDEHALPTSASGMDAEIQRMETVVPNLGKILRSGELIKFVDKQKPRIRPKVINVTYKIPLEAEAMNVTGNTLFNQQYENPDYDFEKSHGLKNNSATDLSAKVHSLHAGSGERQFTIVDARNQHSRIILIELIRVEPIELPGSGL